MRKSRQRGRMLSIANMCVGVIVSVTVPAIGNSSSQPDGSQLLWNSNGDEFGTSIAMQGDFLIIGDPTADGADTGSGQVQIYRWAEFHNTFSYRYPKNLGAQLTATQCPTGSNFGFAVDIDGDYAVVGAPSTADGGTVFLFERNATGFGWSFSESYTWATGSEFGYAVDIDGLVVTVGAPGANSVSSYVIVPGVNGSRLNFVEELRPRSGASARFGFSVDSDGTMLLVGAPTDEVDGMYCGTVSAYWRDPTTHAATLEALLEPESDWQLDLAYFGRSVSADGSNAAVGIPMINPPGSLRSAAAVFTRTGEPEVGDWTLLTTLVGPSSLATDRLGRSVALDSDVLVIGSPGASPNGADSGAALVYRYAPSADNWEWESRIVGTQTSSASSFGTAVAMTNDRIAVGARGNDDPSGTGLSIGAVYVYDELSAGEWQRDTRVTVPVRPSTQAMDNTGTASGFDSFATAVAIDGNTMLVGDPNGYDEALQVRGSVRLFTRSSTDSEWVADSDNVFENIIYSADGDRYGESVVIDGELAVIGAPGAEGSNGKVWIYQHDSVDGWEPLQLILGGTEDRMGASVALVWSGSNAYIAVGATGLRSDTTQGGKVYVYKWDSTAEWATLLWTLEQDGFTAKHSSFGAAVDIEMRAADQVLVAVGNPDYDVILGCVEMHVCFDWGTSWASFFEQRLVPGNEDLDLYSLEWLSYAGSSLDLDGGRVIIGAPISTGVNNRQGSAFVYNSALGGSVDWDWTLEDCLQSPQLSSSHMFFGTSVALSGSRAWVGSPGGDYMAPNGGLVEQFQLDGTDWVFSMALVSSDTQPEDGIGAIIAVSGDTLVCGAPGYIAPDYPVGYDVGDRPHVLGFNVSVTSPYKIVSGGSLTSDDSWPVNPSGFGDVLFSNLLAEPHYVPFDLQRWVGSMSVELDNVMFDLQASDRIVDGSIDVSGPPTVRTASFGVANGTLLVNDNVTIGSDKGVGQLAFDVYSRLEVGDTLTMTDNATLSMALDINYPDVSRLVTFNNAPSLGGGARIAFGPNDLPSDFNEGDRYTLISAGVAPTGGGFDVVVLPGLANGLAFQLTYGAPGSRSQGGCPDGEIEDCNGNCCPAGWLGDGWCDDGSFSHNGIPIYLNCDTLGCDDGDCADCWTAGGAWEMSIEVVSLAGLLDFGDPNSTTVAGDPTGVEVVDLTGDGAEEICVTLAGSPGSLVIFENDGSGGVSQQIVIATGDEPVDITSGDFDGDGRMDLAVANNLSQDVTIYYNDDNDPADGFIEADINVSGPPTCLAGINANFDMYEDLVVGIVDIDGDGNGMYEIYLGAAMLRGGMAGGGDIPAGGDPAGLDPSMEEDQKDHYFSGRQSNGKTAVVGGDGLSTNGVVLTMTQYVTGANPGGMAVGDFDGDGRGDICVTSTTNGTVAILLQDPASPGDFLPAMYVPIGDSPTRMTSVDFDNDGNLDLAAIVSEVNPATGLVEPVVRVLQGNGSLGFTSLETAWGESVALVDSGDVSGDGASELITIGGGAALRSRGGVPQLTLRETSPTCSGDFDANGNVNVDDLLILLGEFSSCTQNCQADMNGDGVVNVDDMLMLIGVWGPC